MGAAASVVLSSAFRLPPYKWKNPNMGIRIPGERIVESSFLGLEVGTIPTLALDVSNKVYLKSG
jgi:hypothetical protein